MAELSLVFATINDSIATNLTMAQAIMQLERERIDYEIILVDNGSDDAEKANLDAFLHHNSKLFPIHYYRYETKGTIPPHSFGIEKATGKYIMTPDPHVVFSEGYFRILLETIKSLKSRDVEVVFTPFMVGNMNIRNGEYICSSHMVNPNPFAPPGSVGGYCPIGGDPFPVMSCTISSMICEREWMLKIGNMFPKSFEIAGGHTAESLIVGLCTWMFGKKCFCQPKAFIEHPVYRNGYGAGRSGNAHLSLATGAYILGGEWYMRDLERHFGKYQDGEFEQIMEIAKDDRKFIEDNATITLHDLVEGWQQIWEKA